MHYSPNEVYHIFNRGNNKQQIFFNDQNYLFFLRKINKQLLPCCDILCWCLMPNHFHLIIHATDKSCKPRSSFGDKSIQELSYRIGILLSTYSQAINKQNETTGSLFQQKTKAKILNKNPQQHNANAYLVNCMHYCHQNPWKAGIVNRIEEWPYSSFLDYSGLRNGKLCNKPLLMELTGYNLKDFYNDSYGVIDGFEEL